MSTAYTAKNSSLTFDGVDIGQIQTIGGPNETKTEIDITNFDSPGNYREYIGGLRDSGELTMTLVLNPSSSTDIKLRDNFALDSGETKVCTLTLGDSGKQLDFSGSIFGLSQNMDLDSAMTQDVTVRISGPVYLSTT